MPTLTIFLIDSDGEIVEMSDRPYDSERLLQELPVYPSVLAGDQMTGDVPGKFVVRGADPNVKYLEYDSPRSSGLNSRRFNKALDFAHSLAHSQQVMLNHYFYSHCELD